MAGTEEKIGQESCNEWIWTVLSWGRNTTQIGCKEDSDGEDT